MKRRSCIICGKKFIPNKYNRHRQITCGREGCKRENHRQNCKRYRRRKEDDRGYKRKESERVKEWQRKHPGYKQKQREKKKLLDGEIKGEEQKGREMDIEKRGGKDREDVLRDFATLEKRGNDLGINVLRDFAKKNEKKIEVGVYELEKRIDVLSLILTGWIAQTCDVLRDDIGGIYEQLYSKGQTIGSIDSKWIFNQLKGEKSYDECRTPERKT